MVTNQLALEMEQAELPVGIGHNRPPLTEQLAEELAPHRSRQAELLAVAASARIVDEDSARKVIDLERIIADFERDLDRRREELKAPYLAAIRLIDGEFHGVIRPLTIARVGEDKRGGLRGMLDAFRRKVEAEAEARRQAAAEEQRRREAEAAEAKRRAEEAKRRGEGSVKDELAALQAAEEAERARLRAETIHPEPMRSHLGQVSARREIEFSISNLRLLLGWMIKQKGLVNQVEQAARTIMGKYLRAAGVAAVERGLDIPGLETSIRTSTAIRR